MEKDKGTCGGVVRVDGAHRVKLAYPIFSSVATSKNGAQHVRGLSNPAQASRVLAGNCFGHSARGNSRHGILLTRESSIACDNER
jgi:hypothetical protein